MLAAAVFGPITLPQRVTALALRLWLAIPLVILAVAYALLAGFDAPVQSPLIVSRLLIQLLLASLALTSG